MSPQVRSSLKGVLRRTWFLGATSFGGPVVHFQIFHRMFVEGPDPWLDEQTVRIVDYPIYLFSQLLVTEALTMQSMLDHSTKKCSQFAKPSLVLRVRKWGSA